MRWPELTRDRIGTLRLRGVAAADALAARRALERALAPLEWQPRSVGRDAIVCVRRLRGTLRSHGGARSPAWRERIDALAAGAARPWHEAVPANALAVVFDDEAELLACLARDAARGVGDAVWWWPVLLGEPAGVGVLTRRWMAAPALLPATLRRLVEHGEAGAAMAAVGESAARAMGERVARAHAVDDWPAARARGGAAARADDPSADGLAPGHQTVERFVARARQSIPGVAATGDATQSVRLVALALVLVERPTLACTPGFARAVHEAVERLAEGRLAMPATEVPVPRDGGAATAVVDHAPPPEAAAAPLALDPEPATPTASPTSPRAPPGAAASSMRFVPADVETRDRQAELPATPPAAAAASPAATPVAAAIPRPRGEPAFEAVHAVDTAFAGLFYLLPIAVHLGWYGDFSQPLAPGLALHPADLLAALGAPACGEGWAADPLPVLLATWAGRDGPEPAGEGFVPPAGQSFGEWLADRRDEMAARAATALDRPPAEVLGWLCRRPGRVVLSPTALEVRFDLATHPLAIRLAGLDRDLGWLPAGGRRITFHFGLAA